MKNKVKRVLLAACTLSIALFGFSGCMATESNVKFNWNGSVAYTVNYQISPQIFAGDDTEAEDLSARTDSFFQSIKEGVEECASAEFTDTSNDEFAGMQFTATFPNVNAMNESGIENVIADQVPAPSVGQGEGVNIHLYAKNHGLYRTYQLLGEIPADILGLNAQMPEMSESDQSLYDVTFSATAPKFVKFGVTSNAPTVEGSTYTWVSDSNSAAVPVEFTLNVPTPLCFVLLGIILLAIIVLIILLIVKSAKKKKSANEEESVVGSLESAEAAFYGDDSEEKSANEEAFSEEALNETFDQAIESSDDAVAEPLEEAADSAEDAATEISEEADEASDDTTL